MVKQAESSVEKHITFLSKETIKEVKALPMKNILVKVSSPTCPPCRKLQSFLEEYTSNKKITCLTVDVSVDNEFTK